MINTDKYEGHSPTYKWMLRGSGEPELHHFADGDVMLTSYWLSCPATKANELLIADAPKLLSEVKRLREELDKSYQERDKNSGALNIALEHLGYQGADHEQLCKEQYECNVYGDELIKCDNIECGGFLVNRYGDCISTISLSESAGCEDEDCCNYYKGSEEE
jgi:hypothetical protein